MIPGLGRSPEEGNGYSLQYSCLSVSAAAAKSLQSCPTLCNPTDGISPGSSVHGDSPSKSTRVDCHALLQGIFPTQELNPSLPHCRQILYHLSHGEAQGSRLQLENLMPSSLSLSPTHTCGASHCLSHLIHIFTVFPKQTLGS